MTENKGQDLTKYLLMFILASFFGWLYEIACVYVVLGKYFDRGVLHIPCCPIYGFGMLILYFLFRKIKNPAAIFFGSVFISTSVEYLTAVVLEYKFHKILWSYKTWPLNFQGRICAISSFLFGVMALLFLKLVVPTLDRAYKSRASGTISLAVVLLILGIVAWEVHFLVK